MRSRHVFEDKVKLVNSFQELACFLVRDLADMARALHLGLPSADEWSVRTSHKEPRYGRSLQDDRLSERVHPHAACLGADEPAWVFYCLHLPCAELWANSPRSWRNYLRCWTERSGVVQARWYRSFISRRSSCRLYQQRRGSDRLPQSGSSGPSATLTQHLLAPCLLIHYLGGTIWAGPSIKKISLAAKSTTAMHAVLREETRHQYNRTRLQSQSRRNI